MSPDPGKSPELGFRDAVSLVVGAVIGSAIFLVPSTVFSAHPSPLAALLVFLAGGVLSWCGALAYAELGGMFPQSGGESVYLRESWGPFVSFLCGWTQFLVIQSAGIAALAVGFGSLVGKLVPVPVVVSAPVLIWALTAVNLRGIRTGARAGNLFTVLKVAGLAVMLVAVAFRGEAPPPDWSWPSDWGLPHLALALAPVLWAYEGWNLVTYVAGEVRDPRRNVPLALAAGLGVIIVVYSASLWVYLRALTVSEIAASTAVAPDAAIRVLGPAGGALVTLTMIFAVVGCTNASVLAAPRLYCAQARDGLLFRRFAETDGGTGAPRFGLLAQAVWAGILSLTGSYEMLLSTAVFAAWVFYGLCAAGVIALRLRRPGADRRYRMWGYPATAVLFVATSAGVVISGAVARPLAALAGLALMAAGIPFYRRFRATLSAPGAVGQ